MEVCIVEYHPVRISEVNIILRPEYKRSQESENWYQDMHLVEQDLRKTS